MNIDIFLASQRKKLQADLYRLSMKPRRDKNCKVESEKSATNCNESPEHKQCNKNPIIDFQQAVDPSGVQHTTAETKKTCIESSMATLSALVHLQQNVNSARIESGIYHVNGSSTTKTAKELANLGERQVAADVDSKNRKYEKSKDDMEQWVSDTFYSYFPGFSNENQKRQDILLSRQLEYQQNFLQHQMSEDAAKVGKHKNVDTVYGNHSDRKPDPIQKPLTSRSVKTDLEIIVNNPDYEGRSPRPGSARHRLFQDLKHTEISNIVNSDGVAERNKRNAELETERKKNYQNELMVQIEEKRRSMEAMKEKERLQEEALARKLNKQLRTMQLEDALDKEKTRADKIQFDSEQNRLMREHLLSKLDTQLLYSTRKTRSENDKVATPNNKVYKYFSNSARHEYKRGIEFEPPAFHLDLSQTSSIHKNESPSQDVNNCPLCQTPLKSYEGWCLKCEKKIFETEYRSDYHHPVCENCKNHYTVCVSCEIKDERNCINCRRKRFTCVKCCRPIQIDNDGTPSEKNMHKTDSEKSFQILEVNYPDESDEDISQINSNTNNKPIHVPYSINIDRNSIFHQNFKHGKLFDHDNDTATIRQKADKRLSRYLKNYRDMCNRSTQTTTDSASRRDVVMMEENNLSMPLLREMPKMTRKESDLQEDEGRRRASRIQNLARRWEIPAVQKHTITTNSPKVLTQLGAIRKQLQSEQFQLDY